MNLLNKLTIKNLKLNKKRTIVTIMGIILSVALISAVSSMYASAVESLIEFEIRQKGNFHVAFYDVPIGDISTFENNRKINDLYLTKHIGYAKLNESKNENKPYAHIMSFDKKSLENLSVKLVEGRLPENEKEILIPTHLKTNGRVILNVGENITLDVGTRVSGNNVLTQLNPFINEDDLKSELKEELMDESKNVDNKEILEPEKIINTQLKNYKIVGIIERPATNIESYESPGYTFITLMNDNDIKTGKVDIYANYTKQGIKDFYKVTANLIDVDETAFEKLNSGEILDNELFDKYVEEASKAKYTTNINTYLIDLQTNPLKSNAVGGLEFVVAIVCMIIIVTSVFCIKNSFDISITEKIKQYGMLRSVGATKKQIRRNVLYEAFILGVIGIPLGILSGLLASYVLMIISNMFLNEMLVFGMELKFKFSLIAIVCASILGILTIYLSATRSSRRASKVEPIESIKNSGNIKIKAKKMKCPKIITKIFGIGGNISYKNLKRNKKKYRTTVISIIVSVSTFIAMSSFVSLAFLEVKNELNIQEYNLTLSLNLANDEIYKKVLNTMKLDDINQVSVLRNRSIIVTNATYSEEMKKEMDIQNSDKIDDFDNNVIIYAVGDSSYKKYIKDLGLNYNEVKNKGILIDIRKFATYDSNTKKTNYKDVKLYSYKKEDKIKGKLDLNDNDFELTIAKVTNKAPFGLDNSGNAMLIVSDEFFDANFNNEQLYYIHVVYDSNNCDKTQEEIEEILDGEEYYINNSEESARMLNNLFTLVAIFLYGFIIVISLIGITNIFNTITTNMELRKREFAMLKSIGMTKFEFNRMIRLESAFMGVKSLFFGIPIGLVLSYLIYHFLSESSGIKYPIPINAIVICIIVVFALITCIMKYSMAKINKQNTIETIRNENI